MTSHRNVEQNSARSVAAETLTWLGGSDSAALEPRERSADTLAGLVVLVTAALAWLAAAVALAGSPRIPIGAAIAIGLIFGMLVGAVSRAVAGSATRNAPALVGRAVGALAVGAIAGELAALALFSGSIDRRIDDQAALAVQSAPAVVAASADLDRARASRADLDTAVERARNHRDEALVVARCEYNPSSDCPQTRITGVPGAGPETRTANGMLADAQQELDAAVAARTDRSARLDAATLDAEQALAGARAAAVTDPDRGLGARWVAMNSLTMESAGALLLRLALTVFFGFLTLLPLLLRMWRGETTHDRLQAARFQCEVADLEAQTAIAVKQAEVRIETESLWAEEQLASARLAAEAQHEINREHHRRRVADAVGTFPGASEPATDDMFLPIAAEAEAASRVTPERRAELPQHGPAGKAELEPSGARPARNPLIPVLPDVTPLANAAARWISPLVPKLLARAIDTTKQPLRAARQAFEEVEEITFSLKRVHKVTLHSEEHAGARPNVNDAASDGNGPGWADSTAYRQAEASRLPGSTPIEATPTGRYNTGSSPLHELAERRDHELSAAADPRSLRGSEGPRELPPAD